jgi:hypothetical protein
MESNIPLTCMSVLMPLIHYLDYYSFVVRPLVLVILEMESQELFATTGLKP